MLHEERCPSGLSRLDAIYMCQPVRGVDSPRGIPLGTRMAVLEVEQRCETQLHPRVQTSVQKRSPYVTTTNGANPNPNTAESMMKPEHRTSPRAPNVAESVALAAATFSVWTQLTMSTGKKSGHSRGMPLVTRLLASSEQAWEPMVSSSVNSCQKTRTVPSTVWSAMR